MNSTPSQSFVPLTAVAAQPAAREFRVSILNGNGKHHGKGSGGGEGDKESNGGNGQLNGNGHHNGNGNGAAEKNEFRALAPLRPVSLNGSNGEKKPCEPRVTVQRDGDRVTHLRIQCTCGQIMDLACVYDETPPSR